MFAVPVELISALKTARRVVIAGHVNPDADCLGSMGALCRALRQRDVRADVAVTEGTISRRMQFLLADAEITPVYQPIECDAGVVVDTARANRVNLPNELGFFGGAPVLNIDHHATNPLFGTLNWVSPQHSSTAEMIFDLLTAMHIEIDALTATALYGGIHADTIGFSLPTATASALAAGAALAKAGAKIDEVCERLHRSRSRGEFELLATVYRNTRISADGRIAWSTVTLAEMQSAGVTPAEIDDQVEVPRSIEGISIAMLFTEIESGKVRVNLRGEKGVAVLPLAEKFGGGGHRGAAGARMRGTVDEVATRFVAAAEALISALTAGKNT